jgi:histidine ammonia-lyase
MAAHAARRLKRMNENLATILGVEAMCAVQGVEARAPLRTSDALQAAAGRFRSDIPQLEDDRYMADDIKAASRLIGSGALCAAGGVALTL